MSENFEKLIENFKHETPIMKDPSFIQDYPLIGPVMNFHCFRNYDASMNPNFGKAEDFLLGLWGRDKESIVIYHSWAGRIENVYLRASDFRSKLTKDELRQMQ